MMAIVHPSNRETPLPDGDSAAVAAEAPSAPAAAPHASPRPTALRTNALWLLIGNAAYAAARALVVFAIVWCGTPAMVGQFVWAVAFCIPTITICRWGGRILLATDAAKEIRFGLYMAFTLIGTVVGLALVVGMIFLWPPLTVQFVQQQPAGLPQWLVLFWPQSVLDSSLIALILIVAVWNSVESVSDIFTALFQRHERMDCIAIAYILQAAIMCVLMTLALLVRQDLLWGAVGLSIAALVRLVAYEIPVGRRLVAQGSAFHPIAIGQATASIRPQFDWSAITRLLKLGAPLAVVMYIMVLTTSIPRYILHDSLGDARLGVFGALFALASAQNLLVASVSQSLTSRLAVQFAARQRASFIRLILRTILLAVGVSFLGLIIALVAGRAILLIVSTPAYAAEVGAFQVLMLLGVVEGINFIVGTAVSSMRRFNVQVPIHLAKLAITYFGMLWVVKYHSLVGVSWILVAVSTFALACYSAVTWWALSKDD